MSNKAYDDAQAKRQKKLSKTKQGNAIVYAIIAIPGYVIDACDMGNLSRFLNHSCTPNCKAQVWSVNDQPRIAISSLRDIKPYEELTFDYNCTSKSTSKFTCKCQSKNCRKNI